MKKILFLPLYMISIIGICKADNPLHAVLKDPTDSRMELSSNTCKTTSSSTRKVAVIDTGFFVEHEGFKGRLASGFNARDINMDVNASIIMSTDNFNYGKHTYHGTHVAGIIAQMDNGVEIVPVKVGAEGHYTNADILECIKSLIGRKDIEAVNISYGLYPNMDYYIKSIISLAKEGKNIVISAGNDNLGMRDIYLPSQKRKLSEVLKELDGRVVFIGATELIGRTRIERRADFSNMPSPTLSPYFISAPGSDILSYVPLDASPAGFGELSGTSMAAPVFVGSMARLATEFNISLDKARQVLFQTAIRKNTSKVIVKETGHGVIDFKAAWNLLKAEAEQKQFMKDKNFSEDALWDYALKMSFLVQ